MANELLRLLPSIDRMLATSTAQRLIEEIGRERVRELLREITEELRGEVNSGSNSVVGVAQQKAFTSHALDPNSVSKEVERRLKSRASAVTRPSLRRVVNATGVIVHTNLGRAPLADEAIEAILKVAGHYSNLEYDLEQGERGHREAHCQELLARLAGTEAALLTNNNAAAVLLVLNTLAEGAEVIVSRGELIEIGGSFRIPEIMAKSGATLREVGTTNRTRISDYERAINANTKLILRVHPSNYRIIGFVERPSIEQISDLSRRTGIPAYEDLGSGCLVDLRPYGVAEEPVVRSSVEAGISVVSFSGDKLLGGPQAGIVAGSHELIASIRKNPLMRVLRADKMTYAGIEATLRLYERGLAHTQVPVIRAIATQLEQIRERAIRLTEMLNQERTSGLSIGLEKGESVIGGGSAPDVKLPTVLIAVTHDRISSAELSERLRKHEIPVIARAERNRVLIDVRTVEPEEERIIAAAIVQATQPATGTLASSDMQAG